MKLHVSLVLVPLDDLTNEIIMKNLLTIKIMRENTAVKSAIWKQGFYVFLDIEETEVTLQVESNYYQTQEIQITLNGSATKIVKLHMIPNQRYLGANNYITVTGTANPGEIIKLYCDELVQHFRLSKDYKEENALDLYHPSILDLSGKEIWIKGREQEWLVRLKSLSEEEEGHYEITPLPATIRKVEAYIYLVYETRCDDEGSFFLLLPKGKTDTFRGRIVCGEKEKQVVLCNSKSNIIEFK